MKPACVLLALCAGAAAFSPPPMAATRGTGVPCSCQSRPYPLASSSLREVSRRGLLSLIPALPAILAPPTPAAAQESPLSATLAAKEALQAVRGCIEGGEWQRGFSTVKSPPLGYSGEGSIKDTSERIGGDEARALGAEVVSNLLLIEVFCLEKIRRPSAVIKQDLVLRYWGETMGKLDQLAEMAR